MTPHSSRMRRRAASPPTPEESKTDEDPDPEQAGGIPKVVAVATAMSNGTCELVVKLYGSSRPVFRIPGRA